MGMSKDKEAPISAVTRAEILAEAKAEVRHEMVQGRLRDEFASLQEATLSVIQTATAKLLAELKTATEEADVSRSSYLIAQAFLRYKESMPNKLIDSICYKSNAIRRSLA